MWKYPSVLLRQTLFDMWISRAGNLQANDTIHPLTLILYFSQSLTAAPWQQCVCVREREKRERGLQANSLRGEGLMVGMHFLSFDWEVNRECAPLHVSECIEVKCRTAYGVFCVGGRIGVVVEGVHIHIYCLWINASHFKMLFIMYAAYAYMHIDKHIQSTYSKWIN